MSVCAEGERVHLEVLVVRTLSLHVGDGVGFDPPAGSQQVHARATPLSGKQWG